MKSAACIAVAALTAAAIPLYAHHSAAAEYVAQMSKWEGVITRFNWTNPHTFVYFDAKDAKGNVVHYTCEGSAPSGLVGNGWNRNTIKAGDKVTIEGWRAKDHDDGCKVRDIVLPGGQKMFMGYVEGISH